MTVLESIVRRGLRVLRMVGELHALGYQRVRIMPGWAPSGMYWRCSVTSAQRIAANHGAYMAEHQRWEPPEVATYSTGQDNEYWGWADARNATASRLAQLFLERFPQICEEGRGQDWAYAGWYLHMLSAARTGALPVAYKESFSPGPVAWLETTEPEVFVLMPPGGESSSTVGLADPWGPPWPRPRHWVHVEMDKTHTSAELLTHAAARARAAGLPHEELQRFLKEAGMASDRQAVKHVISCWFDVNTTEA